MVDGDTLALIYTGHKFHGDPDDEANSTVCNVWRPAVTAFIFVRQGMIVDTPPVSHHFRDLKVWRRESWYMVVGARDGETGQVRIYRSADLRQWQDMGVLAVAERDGLHVGMPGLFHA